MRIFATGVTGFAGSHLVDMLLDQGHQVTGLVHPGSGHQPVPNHKNFQEVTGDLLDLNFLTNVITDHRPDSLFHLAGLASPSGSWENPLRTIMVNTGGTVNILEAARRYGTPRMIIVTSGLIYANLDPDDLPITEELRAKPIHPYGVSKLAAGQLIRLYWERYRLPAIEARPLNHIGPRQSPGFVVPDFVRQISRIKEGKAPPRISVGNLQASRDFTDVRDVARAYMSLAENGKAGESYLVCSGKVVSIEYLLNELIDLAEIDISIDIDPKRLRSLETKTIFGSNRKIREDTGWEPVISLRQSLTDSLNEWNDFWHNES